MNDACTTPSALQVGKMLDQLVKTTDGPLDPEQVTGLFSALVMARCDTAADVLACLAHGNDVVRQACSLLEDEDTPLDRGDVTRLLLWSVLLNARVIEALEGATGLPASGFLGTGPAIN